jgi:hypothetical protein
MIKLERIINHLEANESHRKIANKNKITREFLMQRFPRLSLIGTDSTIEEMISDCLDIDRKIRLAKQKHPHLAGDTKEEKEEYEEKAKEDLGYTITP